MRRSNWNGLLRGSLFIAAIITFGASGALAQSSCTTNEDCADDNACNGLERCDAGACLPGVPLDCDDGNVCTADSCNQQLGCVNLCAPSLDASCFVSLGDYVWNDRDADGVQELGSGIEGVKVELLSCSGGAPSASIGTLKTDAGGGYEFVVPACADESLAVRMTDDNFSPGGALVGFESSPQGAIADDSMDSDCDPSTLETACVDVTLGTTNLDVDCGFHRPPICRGAGFWSTRGGDEKRRGHNITQAALDAAGGSVTVCGQVIDSTIPIGGLDSALEALCVRTRGVKQRQLYRQLTAAKLNCVLSGADDCSDLVPNYSMCDSACTDGDNAARRDVRSCLHDLSCFNKGGRLGDDEVCTLGTCSEDGMDCGSDAGKCAYINTDDDERSDNRCELFEDSCRNMDLCDSPDDSLCFDPPGPASSPKACRDARRNSCTVDSCD